MSIKMKQKRPGGFAMEGMGFPASAGSTSDVMDKWTDWTIRWYQSSILSPRSLLRKGGVGLFSIGSKIILSSPLLPTVKYQDHHNYIN